MCIHVCISIKMPGIITQSVPQSISIKQPLFHKQKPLVLTVRVSGKVRGFVPLNEAGPAQTSEEHSEINISIRQGVENNNNMQSDNRITGGLHVLNLD